MGTVNAQATQRTVQQMTGADCPKGCFPDGAIVNFHKEHEGSRTNLGNCAIQLAKDE